MSNYCQPSRPIASEKLMVDSIRSLAVFSLIGKTLDASPLLSARASR